MANRRTHLLKILTITLFISACDTTPETPDVSGIEAKTKIHRFEKDLFNTRTPQDIERLNSEYPDFYELYARNVLGIAQPNDSAAVYYINQFTGDQYISEVKQRCDEAYTQMHTLEEDFNSAFRYYQHYFPGKQVPKLVSFMSGFKYTIMVDDSLLAFGLDMYLGKDSEFYPRIGIPQYRFRKMSREHIVPDCMKGWVATEYEPNTSEDDLISLMIYHGKLLYALDLLLPEMDDSVKIGYSGEHIQWCKDNEAEIWFHFVDREVLYKRDVSVFTKYMNEGPFTPGFPEGSPGEVGKWVGWQIVRKYMENNSSVTLQDLFRDGKKAAEILNQSHYKPNK